MERAQTEGLRIFGVADRRKLSEVNSGIALESAAKESKSLVHEVEDRTVGTRVPRDTSNPVGSRGVHPPRLNTTK